MQFANPSKIGLSSRAGHLYIHLLLLQVLVIKMVAPRYKSILKLNI